MAYALVLLIIPHNRRHSVSLFPDVSRDRRSHSVVRVHGAIFYPDSNQYICQKQIFFLMIRIYGSETSSASSCVLRIEYRKWLYLGRSTDDVPW